MLYNGNPQAASLGTTVTKYTKIPMISRAPGESLTEWAFRLKTESDTLHASRELGDIEAFQLWDWLGALSYNDLHLLQAMNEAADFHQSEPIEQIDGLTL